jgi:hypothetical protein
MKKGQFTVNAQKRNNEHRLSYDLLLHIESAPRSAEVLV